MLMDSNGNIKYVGRTNNPARRDRENKNDKRHPEREGYEMKVAATKLNLLEAKAMEQAVISAYDMKKLGGDLDNLRREIAVGGLWQYRKEILEILKLFDTVREDELRNLMGG